MTYLDLSLDQVTENLSPQQKKFNRLIKKLEQLKSLSIEWNQAREQVQRDAAVELLPLYSQWHQILFQQLQVLWQHKNTQKFARTYAEHLDEKIQIQLSQLWRNPSLSEQQQVQLSEIAEFYQIPMEVHQEIPAEQEDAHDLDQDESRDERILEKNMFKQLIADQIGIPVDWIDFDFDPENLDEFMQKLQQKLDQEEAEFIQTQLNGSEREEYIKFAEKEKRKALKKQAQLEQAHKTAGKSLKSIYLKIASLIHPDREQDEQKQIEKTELLQQANRALEDKDLLTLLKLRAYIENDNKKQMDKIANEHLKSYNLLLEEQIGQLQDEIDSIVYSFDWESSGFYKQTFKPTDLAKKYQRDLADIQKKLSRDKVLLSGYQDITDLKHLLKSRMFAWGYD